MRNGWLRHALGAWFELLLLLPVFLVVEAWLVPDALGAVWLGLLPVVSLVGVWCGGRWSVLWQQLGLSTLAGAAVAFGLSGGDLSLFLVVTFLVMGIVCFLGMTIEGRISDTKWYLAGLTIYFVAAVLFPRLSVMADRVPVVTTAGVCCLVITLFITNRSFLREATLSRQAVRVPRPLRRQNRWFMGGILGVGVLLTLLFGNVFGSMLFAVLRWLIGLLTSSETAEEQEELPPPPPPTEQGLPEGGNDPGLLGYILNIIGYVIGGAILLGVAAAVGYWLYKYSGGIVRKWMKWLFSFLRRTNRKEAADGYVDEETVVFSWEAIGDRLRASWLGRLAAGGRGERWEEQRTNEERVRYLYRTWLRGAASRGYVHKRELTPRETAEDLAAWTAAQPGKKLAAVPKQQERTVGVSALLALYYRVRYGAAQATDEETEAMRRLLE